MRKITLAISMVFGLCMSVTYSQTVFFYDDFRFDANSGFTGFVTSNVTMTPETTLIKRIGSLPSEGELGYTRPANNIGTRTDVRVQTSVNLAGNDGGGNFEGVSWLVTDAVDISSFTGVEVSFATRNRFHEGSDDDPFSVLVTTNYTDGTDPSTVTWTDVTGDIVDITNTFGNDGNWAVSKLNLTSYIAAMGSDKFALAFKFEFFNSGTFSTTTNRNGTWGISDVRYLEDATLSSKNNILNQKLKVSLQNNVLSILKTSEVNIIGVKILNSLGQEVLTLTDLESVDLNHLTTGVYFLKVESSKNGVLNKKIIIN